MGLATGKTAKKINRSTTLEKVSKIYTQGQKTSAKKKASTTEKTKSDTPSKIENKKTNQKKEEKK